jgi:hypothetical protein
MAILSDNDRAALWAEVMREMSRQGELCSITKTDLRAAVNAVDAWVDSNTTSFNTAIPQPARSALTTAQKARLLMYVVRRRFEVS